MSMLSHMIEALVADGRFSRWWDGFKQESVLYKQIPYDCIVECAIYNTQFYFLMHINHTTSADYAMAKLQVNSDDLMRQAKEYQYIRFLLCDFNGISKGKSAAKPAFGQLRSGMGFYNGMSFKC